MAAKKPLAVGRGRAADGRCVQHLSQSYPMFRVTQLCLTLRKKARYWEAAELYPAEHDFWAHLTPVRSYVRVNADC